MNVEVLFFLSDDRRRLRREYFSRYPMEDARDGAGGGADYDYRVQLADGVDGSTEKALQSGGGIPFGHHGVGGAGHHGQHQPATGRFATAVDGFGNEYATMRLLQMSGTGPYTGLPAGVHGGGGSADVPTMYGYRGSGYVVDHIYESPDNFQRCLGDGSGVDGSGCGGGGGDGDCEEVGAERHGPPMQRGRCSPPSVRRTPPNWGVVGGGGGGGPATGVGGNSSRYETPVSVAVEEQRFGTNVGGNYSL